MSDLIYVSTISMLDDFENIKISARVNIKKSLTSHINIKIYNLGF